MITAQHLLCDICLIYCKYLFSLDTFLQDIIIHQVNLKKRSTVQGERSCQRTSHLVIFTFFSQLLLSKKIYIIFQLNREVLNLSPPSVFLQKRLLPGCPTFLIVNGARAKSQPVNHGLVAECYKRCQKVLQHCLLYLSVISVHN